MLNVEDHSRDSAGLKYVYAVVSRRAGGVSVGINLNINNACNWACIYCQVPNLRRGGPPPIDLEMLERELRGFLGEILFGDYLQRNAPAEARRLVDVALSGNGEPTSAAEFAEVVERVGRLIAEFGLQSKVKLRLITNGSLMRHPYVQHGVARIGELGGEVWFKLDRATEAGIRLVNGVGLAPQKIVESILLCAGLAPTWIQSCFFAIDGEPPGDQEVAAYLELLASVGKRIQGVHLYGLARPSMQPEKTRLSALPPDSLEALSRRIDALGIQTVVSP